MTGLISSALLPLLLAQPLQPERAFERIIGNSSAIESVLAFQWHSWPGNIRELQNMVERAVILSRDGVLPDQSTGRATVESM